MSARPAGNFTDAERAYYSRWYDSSAAKRNHDLNNNLALSFASADDSTSLKALSADIDNLIHLDRATLIGARQSEQFFFAVAGGLVTQAFFIANRPMVITGIQEIHSIAETAAGTATLTVTKDSPGSAPGAGTVVLSGTFNLKATANTVQNGTLLGVDGLGQPNAAIILAVGDRLSIKIGGTATITALAGVCLTVHSAPGFKETYANFSMAANAGIATQAIFLANRDLSVQSVLMAWSTAATDSGTVTLDLTVETSTTAPGGGTSILAAAQSVKLTANTPVLVPLSATAANLLLAAGSRLSVKTAGALTALAGVVVQVALGSIGNLYLGQVEVTFGLKANGSLATQGFFLADRDYEVVDASGVESTAGTDSGAVTLDITIDKGVVAPGAGATALAGTISLKATANTVVVPGISTSRRARLLSKGDLLSAKFTGTLTALAGVVSTVSLLPR